VPWPPRRQRRSAGRKPLRGENRFRIPLNTWLRRRTRCLGWRGWWETPLRGLLAGGGMAEVGFLRWRANYDETGSAIEARFPPGRPGKFYEKSFPQSALVDSGAVQAANSRSVIGC
jgi:hypothetical protein